MLRLTVLHLHPGPSMSDADEKAFFAVWFQLQRRDHWKNLYPTEPFHEEWGLGYERAMWEAWQARASLHVTYTDKSATEPK